MRIIAGEWGGRLIDAPPGRSTRPTGDRVREAWMSAIAPMLGGARVVDLFAGSGALGLEALSRGAEHAVFVEQAPAALRVLRANIDRLGTAPRATVVQTDALRYAASAAQFAFDIAFADPPYATDRAERLARIFQTHPFARRLCIEHGPADLPAALPGARTRRYGDTRLTFIDPPE